MNVSPQWCRSYRRSVGHGAPTLVVGQRPADKAGAVASAVGSRAIRCSPARLNGTVHLEQTLQGRQGFAHATQPTLRRWPGGTGPCVCYLVGEMKCVEHRQVHLQLTIHRCRYQSCQKGTIRDVISPLLVSNKTKLVPCTVGSEVKGGRRAKYCPTIAHQGAKVSGRMADSSPGCTGYGGVPPFWAGGGGRGEAAEQVEPLHVGRNRGRRTRAS